jgi:hypothetical protein
MLFLITLLFMVSVTINVVLVWYIRLAIREIIPLHERADDLAGTLGEFCDHVEGVYELPVFYGDATIKGLLQHSKDIVNEVEAYKKSFIFEQDEEVGFEEAETQAEGGE